MPNAEQVKQFLVGVVVPVVTGVIAAWIVGTVHILNLFHITEGQVAGEVSVLVTWGVTTVITWLHQHHVLSAHYTPAAKDAVGK